MLSSLTYKAVIVWLVYNVFKWSGFEIPGEGSVESAIDLIINLVLALTALYGRWRAGGLSVFGARK